MAKATAPNLNLCGTTISLLNMKGGVGKTTLAVNLAWSFFSDLGKRVLLIDLDPQFNASQYLMSHTEWDTHRRKKGTVADLLLDPRASKLTLQSRTKKGTMAETIHKCIFAREDDGDAGCLHLVPSELVLAGAVKNPQGVSFKLEKALRTILDGYDVVIIDCAPTDSVLTDTALTASDFVLIPVRPDRFSVLGYAAMQQTLATFRDESHDPHKVRELGVVFNHVFGNSSQEERSMGEVATQASYVFKSRIRVSSSYNRAIHAKRAVFDTPYTRLKTKLALSKLTAEVVGRISQLTGSGD